MKSSNHLLFTSSGHGGSKLGNLDKRAFPLVRRIWKEVGHGVNITDDVHLKRLLAGEETIQPVGFPREDVFRFDPELAAEMDDLVKKGKWDWTKLVPV